MKIALVSDVHGNLEALRAVLAAAGKAGADAVYCLGDMVGYGPEPQECVDLLRREAAVVIVGNHDAAVTGRTSEEEFNEAARIAVTWTRGRIDEGASRYLAALPYEEQRGDLHLVHASPEDPPRWHYLASAEAAERAFDFAARRICAVGHTHSPFVASLGTDGRAREDAFPEVPLEADRRYLVNVGSVGQPRDGDRRAAFVMLDEESLTLRLHRVEYPVEKTQQLMDEAGLPGFLVMRLSQGI